jgi:hypothetical protein
MPLEQFPPEHQISAPENSERCFIFSKNLSTLKETVCKKYTPTVKKDISEKSN